MSSVPDPRCKVCEQALAKANGTCGNPVCGWTDRSFDWNRSVAMRDGALERSINRYKYEKRTGWAWIFGRVLAGFLYENSARFSTFDLIIPSPTYVGPDGRDFDHTAEVLAEAARLDETGLPYVVDSTVIEKSATTKRLATCESWQERRYVCENEVRPVLHVPEPQRIAGKQILVYDDIFTDGLNLNVVASVLRGSGADRVCGVTLARQPWGGRLNAV